MSSIGSKRSRGWGSRRRPYGAFVPPRTDHPSERSAGSFLPARPPSPRPRGRVPRESDAAAGGRLCVSALTALRARGEVEGSGRKSRPPSSPGASVSEPRRPWPAASHAPPPPQGGAGPSRLRPQIRRDNPLNLSILLSGGKETNQDSLSSGERRGKSPAPNPRPTGGRGKCGVRKTACPASLGGLSPSDRGSARGRCEAGNGP